MKGTVFPISKIYNFYITIIQCYEFLKYIHNIGNTYVYTQTYTHSHTLTKGRNLGAVIFMFIALNVVMVL